MDRQQAIEIAAIYRCGKTLHHFDGGSKTYESISKAKKAVGPRASCVAELPGERLFPKMQERWIAEEARQEQARKDAQEAERIAAEKATQGAQEA